ncbi:MAG: MBL fold metallo-hydrolase [Muribaculaceae bacterium]|nr:MBL fold metallo-hydrolase [Muribaculaceae bacterium]MDE6754965.1 MBL fold metallo-hydrolase [Muribaculaceae bacterium]
MKVAIFQFQLFGINTYVVYDQTTHKCAVIDPGMLGEEEEEAMSEFLKRNNLTLTNVINTHLHIDHAVGNRYLRDKFKAPVLAHRDDEPLGSRMQQQAIMFGINNNFDELIIDKYLEDGDIIKIGNGELEVIAVPGHSLGSIALYDKADNFVIVGDALFQGSIGRTDLPGGNYNQLINSIKSRLFSLPDNTVVYPGHGNPTTIGAEKRSNPFLK